MGFRLKVAVLAFALSAAALTLLRSQTVATLATEEWPPYNYTEAGELKGFSAELVLAIAKDLDVPLRIEILPGSRARELLEKGPGVIFISMFRTPERERLYKWIGPIDLASFYFYRRKGDPLVVSSLDDARRAPSVACRNTGLVYSFLLASGFRNLDPSSNPSGIYLKVLDGRCSLAIGETPLGVSYILRQLGFPSDALVQTPLHILEANLYIACSLDVPDAEVARWQAGLDRLKASGEFARIYARYLR